MWMHLPSALSPELSRALIPACARTWVRAQRLWTAIQAIQVYRRLAQGPLPRDSHLNSSPRCAGEKPRVTERLTTWAVSDTKHAVRQGVQTATRSTKEYDVLVSATLVPHGKETATQQKSLGFPKTATFLNPTTLYWSFQSLPQRRRRSF